MKKGKINEVNDPSLIFAFLELKTIFNKFYKSSVYDSELIDIGLK